MSMEQQAAHVTSFHEQAQQLMEGLSDMQTLLEEKEFQVCMYNHTSVVAYTARHLMIPHSHRRRRPHNTTPRPASLCTVAHEPALVDASARRDVYAGVCAAACITFAAVGEGGVVGVPGREAYELRGAGTRDGKLHQRDGGM